jgi:hypothetical protein
VAARMPGPPPSWVISKLREMIADGLTVALVAGQLTNMGHACTARQVKRWKTAHRIRAVARPSDQALDAVISELHESGLAGKTEGYRWVHSAVKDKLGSNIGKDRVRKALLRVAPEEVEARKRLIERRLIRRVYSADYYLQAGHIDFNCKATLPGGVKLYSYGHVRRAPSSAMYPCLHNLIPQFARARSLMATLALTWPWRFCS